MREEAVKLRARAVAAAGAAPLRRAPHSVE